MPADAEWTRHDSGVKRRLTGAPKHPAPVPLPASWPAPGDPLPFALAEEVGFRALGRDMLLFAFHFQQARRTALSLYLLWNVG